MLIRDPGWKKFGSEIRDNHPGSATLIRRSFAKISIREELRGGLMDILHVEFIIRWGVCNCSPTFVQIVIVLMYLLFCYCRAFIGCIYEELSRCQPCRLLLVLLGVVPR
jgi:hypothetical protein